MTAFQKFWASLVAANPALRDEDDKILFLVSPAPGLNLHRYVQAKIGVVGQKGFHQKYKLDHITAERVVRLKTTR